MREPFREPQTLQFARIVVCPSRSKLLLDDENFREQR